MLCFLTVRRLKPGAYEAFREAWQPAEWPEGFTRAYHLRNLSDEDQVISFGFFEGGPEELARLRSDERFAEERERQLERMAAHVDSVGTDAIFEVLEEVTPRR